MDFSTCRMVKVGAGTGLAPTIEQLYSSRFFSRLSFLSPQTSRVYSPAHEEVVRVVATAVSTVMRNWMTVFQVFWSFKSFIVFCFFNGLTMCVCCFFLSPRGAPWGDRIVSTASPLRGRARWCPHQLSHRRSHCQSWCHRSASRRWPS